MNGIIGDSDYTKKNNELDIKIDSLNDRIEQINSSVDSQKEVEEKLKRIKAELKNGLADEEKITFIMDRVQKIVVNKDHLDITLDVIGNLVATVGDDKSLNVITSRQQRPRLEKTYYIYTPRRNRIPVYLHIA